MEKVIDIPIINASKQSRTYYGRVDPSKTLPLQNAFVKAMNAKFYKLKASIRKAIIQDDVFGLKKQLIAQAIVLPGSPGWHAFDFATSQQKVENFMNWLNKQIDDDLLQVKTMQRIGGSINQAWTDRWIADSYKRGLLRARYELKKAGYNVPGMNETGGVEASMSTPFNMDVVGVLYTRTFEGLKGITSAMSNQISQVLSQGMIDGDGTTLLAKKLVAVIDGTGMGTLAIKDTLGRFIPAQRRAELLARTEVMRAHHIAMVQEYKNWKANNVIVKAEWATAGDIHVCDICSSMEGSVWTLNQIQNMIPAHPLCRCVAIPTKKVLQKPEGQQVKLKEKVNIKLNRPEIDLSNYPDAIQKVYNSFVNEQNAKQFLKYYDDFSSKIDSISDEKDWQLIRKAFFDNEQDNPYNFIDGEHSLKDFSYKIREIYPDKGMWKDWLGQWGQTTQSKGGQLIRYMAKKYEKDLPDMVFSDPKRKGIAWVEKYVQKQFKNEEEMQQVYLRFRAFSQAYLERVFPAGKITLYRGISGDVGTEISKNVLKIINGNMARTLLHYKDMTLVGYSSNYLIADDFGASKGVILYKGKKRLLNYELVVKKEIPINQVFAPTQLFSWLTRRFIKEREYIVIGETGVYNLKDLRTVLTIFSKEDGGVILESWESKIGSSGFRQTVL